MSTAAKWAAYFVAGFIAVAILADRYPVEMSLFWAVTWRAFVILIVANAVVLGALELSLRGIEKKAQR